MIVYRPISVSGNDQYGNHIDASGTLKDKAPISQQELSHDELCNNLHEPPRISKGKTDPAADTYERNKMRQKEGC